MGTYEGLHSQLDSHVMIELNRDANLENSGERKDTIKQIVRHSKPDQRPIMESKEFDNLILMQLNRKGLEQ